MFSLLTALAALKVSENLTIYPLVQPAAGQGWKLELFELSEPIAPHYHKIQRQILLVTEGRLAAYYRGEEPVLLQSGEFLHVDPGVVHFLIPQNKAQFFSLDLPGFNHPDDVYHDTPTRVSLWNPPEQKSLPPLAEPHFRNRFEKGSYAVYDLATGVNWGAALLEIQDSPRHYHKIEKEVFAVVNGRLDIEVDGVHQVLGPGEVIEILPGSIHHLRSAASMPARIICFSFPAFDPADMYLVE